MLTNEMFKALLVYFGVNLAASYTHTQRKGCGSALKWQHSLLNQGPE